MLIASLAGCGGRISGQVEEDSGPFYDDRVVTVRTVMADEDWKFMQKNTRDEEYAKADFGLMMSWCLMWPSGRRDNPH